MPRSTPDTDANHASLEAAWTIVLAASRAAEDAALANTLRAFAVGADGELVQTSDDDPLAVVGWRPDSGWDLRLNLHDIMYLIAERR